MELDAVESNVKGFDDDFITITAGEHKKEVVGRKSKMAAISDVFDVMLNGGWREGTDGVIMVPDVCPDALTTLLRYADGDRKQQIQLNPDNIWNILVVADKYQVLPVVRHCFRFLLRAHPHISRPQHVCEVLELAHRLHQPEFCREGLEIAKGMARHIFSSHLCLQELCRDCMLELVKADSVGGFREEEDVDETLVHKAVVTWALCSWYSHELELEYSIEPSKKQMIGSAEIQLLNEDSTTRPTRNKIVSVRKTLEKKDKLAAVSTKAREVGMMHLVDEHETGDGTLEGDNSERLETSSSADIAFPITRLKENEDSSASITLKAVTATFGPKFPTFSTDCETEDARRREPSNEELRLQAGELLYHVRYLTIPRQKLKKFLRIDILGRSVLPLPQRPSSRELAKSKICSRNCSPSLSVLCGLALSSASNTTENLHEMTTGKTGNILDFKNHKSCNDSDDNNKAGRDEKNDDNDYEDESDSISISSNNNITKSSGNVCLTPANRRGNISSGSSNSNNDSDTTSATTTTGINNRSDNTTITFTNNNNKNTTANKSNDNSTNNNNDNSPTNNSTFVNANLLTNDEIRDLFYHNGSLFPANIHQPRAIRPTILMVDGTYRVHAEESGDSNHQHECCCCFFCGSHRATDRWWYVKRICEILFYISVIHLVVFLIVFMV